MDKNDFNLNFKTSDTILRVTRDPLKLVKWVKLHVYFKLGSFDVRDQSRSRSRTSTFENGRDYPSRRDRLLFYLGRDF